MAKQAEGTARSSGRRWLRWGCGCLGIVALALLVIIAAIAVFDRYLQQVAVATLTATPAPSPTPPPTFQELKESAVTLDYDEMFRHNEDHVGKIVYFTGQVIQGIEEDETSFELRVNVTRGEFDFWDDTVFLDYSGERLLEDDIIEFVGTVMPLVSYESIFGQKITIPGVRVIQARLLPDSAP